MTEMEEIACALRELRSERDAGKITDAEYEDRRREVLSSLSTGSVNAAPKETTRPERVVDSEPAAERPPEIEVTTPSPDMPEADRPPGAPTTPRSSEISSPPPAPEPPHPSLTNRADEPPPRADPAGSGTSPKCADDIAPDPSQEEPGSSAEAWAAERAPIPADTPALTPPTSRRRSPTIWLLVPALAVVVIVSILLVQRFSGSAGPGSNHPPVPLDVGSLIVNVDIAAQVTVDGWQAKTGKRVMFRDLSKGSHRVKIFKEGYFVEDRPVTIRAGETSRMQVRLSRKR